MTTIGDIARILGITAGTVSRALRSDPRVKEKTRLEVLAQAKKMDYVPNRAAQHLARGKSDTIWILLGSLEWIQERHFASACNTFLWNKGYRALIVLHDNNEHKLKTILQDLASGSADGAMVLPTFKKNPLTVVKDIKVPLLFIDRWIKGLKVPVVTSNNKDGSWQLLQKALGEGPIFSNVLSFREANNEVERDRQRGLVEACNDYGIALQTSGANLPSNTPFAIYGNSQNEIQAWLSQQTENIVRQCVSILTWDQWLGSTLPAQTVFVALQDFEGMAQLATDFLLDWIETGVAKHTKTQVPLLEVATVHISTVFN